MVQTTRTRRRVLLLLSLTLCAAPLPASDDQDRMTERVFNLKPALDSAVVHALSESSQRASDSEARHQRVARLLVPAGMASSAAAESAEPDDEEPWPGDWLVGGFNKTSGWVTGGLVLGLGSMLGFADEEDVRDLGDITQLIPAITALGVTIGVRDWQGLKQFSLAGGTALVATHGIKNLVEKSRPDDSATNSFPSGHTSASVTGAAFLWRRYGPRWGAPASVLAAYTGFSRVVGQKHFMDDVVSGAAIGLISNWLWTDPIDERVRMALFPTRGGAAITVEIDPTAQKRRGADTTVYGSTPVRYFYWEIGLANVTRNDVLAPNPGGTPVDWRFDEENNPTATATVAAGWSTPSRKHNVFLSYAPFEVREVLEIENDIEFANRSVSAGTEVQSRYLAYDFRAGYGFSVVNSPKLGLSLGGTLAVLDTFVSLTSEKYEVSEGAVTLRPMVSVSLDAALGRRWLAYGFFDWWSDSEFEIVDFTAQVAYRLHPKWAVSLGYRRVDRMVDLPEIFNEADRNQIAIGVWYVW